MAADILLVIPAFRESHRLPPYLQELTNLLSSARFKIEILVVDDGSPPQNQQKLLSDLPIGIFGSCHVLNPILLPSNHGKGHAIIHGWRSRPDTNWFSFVDADGATPAYEVLRVFNMAMQADAINPPCFWASRVRLLGKKIHRTLRRHLLGRIFASIASNVIDMPVYDTQCGFKVIPQTHYRKIAPLLQEPRFCFDIELLLAVHHAGATVIEIPIDWCDMPGGQLHAIRDGMAMLRRLPAIRRRSKNWPLIRESEQSY